MKELRTKQAGVKTMGLLVLLNILLVAAVLAVGYVWMDGRFTQLENQIDSLSAQQAREDQETNDNLKVAPPIAPVTEYKSKKGAVITVTSPLENANISSPLKIKGKAPGSWFFEGQFSVSLKDSDGNIIARGATDIAEDAQTSKQVEFTATLAWTKEVNGNGTLVLEKSNPSGLPENADSLEITVKL